MVSVPVLSQIVSGQPVLAQPVTYNFSAIATAINSQKLNSDNFSASGIYSQNIVSNAIVSQHISAASNIPSAKIGANAVIHDNLVFSGASYANVWRVAAASSDARSKGVRLGLATATVAATSDTESNTYVLSRSQNSVYGPAAFTARRVAFEIEDTMRRGKIIAPSGLLRGYPNRVTARYLREHVRALDEAKTASPEPFRGRLDRDIRYLECAAKYMDFVLPYAEAVDAAKKHSITAKEINDLRHLLKLWLDNQEELVRSGLKGDGYLDRCIGRDTERIEAWLDKNKPTQNGSAPR